MLDVISSKDIRSSRRQDCLLEMISLSFLTTSNSSLHSGSTCAFNQSYLTGPGVLELNPFAPIACCTHSPLYP